MTPEEIKEAYDEGCKACEYLGERIRTIGSELEKMTLHDPSDAKVMLPVIEYTLYPIMETLGDLLSNMDAVTEEDDGKLERAYKLVQKIVAEQRERL